MENQLIKYVGTHDQYHPAEVMETLLPMNKSEVIVFLAWDEPKGKYLDLDRSNEGLPPLTECECKLMAMATICEAGRLNNEVVKALRYIATWGKSLPSKELWGEMFNRAKKVLATLKAD